MTDRPWILAAAALVGGLALWLLLPRGRAAGRALGLVLAAVGLGLWAAGLRPLGDWIADGVFYILAGMTIGAAAAAVTLRNPVYAAIWFGVSLLGTAALLACQGAQLLAAATVIVYAGAILVTFLFILMLAQPQGRAVYDRVSWKALVSALAGTVMVALLTVTVARLPDELHPVPAPPPAPSQAAESHAADNAVADLGRQLFGRYLIAVEGAGMLLLVALVGAAVIAGRPGAASPTGASSVSGPATADSNTAEKAAV